ncbi:MAG: 5-formyltetrahydrofolate cyclo-ligase [Paludibacteraceae bacterium]
MRSILEQRRRVYPESAIAADSATIISHIEQMHTFQNAETVLAYYPIHNEVDLRALLEKYRDTKTILLPVTHRRYMEVRQYEGEALLHRGRMRVPEPQGKAYTGKIDLILVPGVVFDTKCHRIGRGGGYYDKFLGQHKESFKMGVCYDFQLKHQPLPTLWHDQPMDRVVSPSLVVDRSRK